MKSFITCAFAAVFSFLMLGSVNAATIDFDDIEGMSGPFEAGQSIPAQYIVDDEYLSHGVLFESEGGGIRVVRAGNAISYPNLASGTITGNQRYPVADYDTWIRASFWVDGVRGLVDTAGLTISNFNGSGVLKAYGLNGSLLGSISSQESPTLSLVFPGQIHSVTFIPKHAVFDNFTFDGLQEVPAPGAVWLLLSGLAAIQSTRLLRKNR